MTTLTESDWGRIFAKGWTDPGFHAEFESDPRAALTKYAKDLNIDPNAKFSVPAKSSNISDADAKQMAEGSIDPHPMYCC